MQAAWGLPKDDAAPLRERGHRVTANATLRPPQQEVARITEVMGTSDRRDLRRALVEDLEQIEDNVALYKAGRDSAYQTVALQLRVMLLSEQRGLLARVLPNATLHPVRGK